MFSGVDIINNTILLTKLETEIYQIWDTPNLNLLFYNNSNNKFVKSSDLQKESNFKISLNNSSDSF